MSKLWITLNVCTEPEILKVLKYIQIILDYAFIIVPIGLILMVAIDFTKNVIAKDANEMQKNLSIAIKRIIYCVAMFFVPTIVSFVMTMVNDSITDLNVDYEGCLANIEYLEYYEQIAAAKTKDEEEELQRKIDEQKKKAAEQEIFVTYTSGSGTGELTLDWNDVTKISNVSAATLKETLETSDYYYKQEARFAPYAAQYVHLEQEHGVNVFLLLGIHALESFWLDSAVTKECNNIGGVKFANQNGAYKCTISSEGDYYAGWPNLKAFLLYYVPWIKREYLTEGGSYYKGTTPEAIGTSYCNPTTWPAKVRSIGTGLFNQVKAYIESQ